MADPFDESLVLPEAARQLGHLFAAAGFSLFVVGGAVRDQLLGLGSFADDIDLTTDARPPDILKIVEPIATAVWRQGEKFGTIGANVFDRAVEITTFRSETYSDDSRKPVVGFGNDLRTDLSRRDFTINAIARDARTGELADPFDGEADLARRLLRTPLEAQVSFSDDPLRMLRAARFAARLDLTMDPGLVVAAAELAGRMEIVSGERIYAETDRLLGLPDPSAGLKFLWETGVLSAAFDRAPLPSFASAEDVAERMVLTSLPVDRGIRWAALCLFIGIDVEDLTDSLRLSTEVSRDLQMLTSTRLCAPSDLPELRRLILRPGVSDVRRVVAVQGLLEAGGQTVTAFAEAFDQLSLAESAKRLKPQLSGAEIMKATGVQPGPIVGRIRDHLEALAIASGPLSVEESVHAALRVAAEPQ